MESEMLAKSTEAKIQRVIRNEKLRIVGALVLTAPLFIVAFILIIVSGPLSFIADKLFALADEIFGRV